MPARVVGESGPPVMLLPGGAESSEGFFPGLVEALVADPGCRVVLYDRPGTGTSTETGSLAGAADALKAVVDELGTGPVVVVRQSLGGAVATLLTRDHPDVVAGMVLLDPTPLNDPAVCARTLRTLGVLRTVTSLPLLGRLVTAGLAALLARQRRGLRPDCAAAHERISGFDVPKLARATEGLPELAAGFREADLPRLPAVVVTADRKPTSLVSWPKATHDVHLSHPDDTLRTVREVVGRVAAGHEERP